MSTPSTAYPYSPTPASPMMPSELPLSPPDERRRSKRASTASATRRREEAASRYPSPPPGNVRSRPHSIDASLQIPPYNPNRRPSPTTSVSTAPVLASQMTKHDEFEASRTATMDASSISSPQPPSSRSTSSRPSAPPIPLPQRPASADTVPTSSSAILLHVGPSGGASVSSRSRQSVGYLPTHSVPSAGPYPQLYTPHQMPRQKIYFGPYILLQTLGEGEFGKVKLGVHSERWGEDVAIKLIKRGNVDTAQRGEKVRREIEVLKAVRHPNIVRLYDVIETEKYIGIVLEYASGGELFDHILAHRYLKERDASRLFAQLISGVAYLHAKKIVHRDLKLENLLLDRNRNVIITDFGFANRFNHATNDLMATSCGSPCYAAPELVVQEGKYVGTAVDVWSCGVILYAMLAGYLPYDDDPANPEGDNINLLYKYIINTPLIFPDWISEEPRNLLLMMLVSDPKDRCSIEDVICHPWLAKYYSGFQKTVEDLEHQAQEQEYAKRQMLEAQRQFLVQQQAQQQQVALTMMPPNMSRSQSSNVAATRHRSAIVPSVTTQQLYRPAEDFPNQVSIQNVQTYTGPPSSVRQSHLGSPNMPTTHTSKISVDADSFSYDTTRSTSPPQSVAMQPSLSAPPDPPTVIEDDSIVANHHGGQSIPLNASLPNADSTSVTSHSRRSATHDSAPMVVESDRRNKAHRNTIQLEYAGRAPSSSASTQVDFASSYLGSQQQPQPTSSIPEDVDMYSGQSHILASVAESPGKPLPPIAVGQSSDVSPRPLTPPLIPLILPSTPPRTPSNISSALATTPKKRKSSGSPYGAANPEVEKALPLTLPISSEKVTAGQSQAHTSNGGGIAVADQTKALPSVVSGTSARVRQPLPSDRFSIRSLLNASSQQQPGEEQRQRRPQTTTTTTAAASTTTQKPAVANKISEALEEVTNRRRSRRQKALSLQPFNKQPTKITKPSRADGNAVSVAGVLTPVTREGPRTRSGGGGGSAPPEAGTGSVSGSGAMLPPQQGQTARVRPVSVAGSSRFSRNTIPSEMQSTWGSGSAAASSGKAKAVMDWFRRRGAKGSGSENAALPIPVDFDKRENLPLVVEDGAAPAPNSAPTQIPAQAASSVTPVAPAMERTPSVVVTEAAVESRQSPQSSRSVSGTHSQLSNVSQATAASTAATTVTNGSIRSAVVTPQPITIVTVFNPMRLRTHQGALDKSALTYRSPADVIVDVRNALWSMGVNAVPEGDFKFKCVRKSKKKALANTPNYGLGLGPVSSGMVASMSSSALSTQSGLERRNSLFGPSSIASGLTTSPSTTFKAFFRKSSSTALSPSPEFYNTDYSAATSEMGTPGSQPAPVYGDGPHTDSGDEVRFYVELTRVKNLERLYCVDVKRMRGGPWSFKHVYDQLLDSLELGPA